MEEIRFAMKCSLTKPVKKRKGSSNESGSKSKTGSKSNNSESTPPYGIVPTVITPDDEKKK